MAGSVNKVFLIGNLGKDPDIRQTQTGGKIASFSMATSESWKDKVTGERKENVQWHRVVVFNEALVGVVERFLRKGSKVFLEGQLESRKWTGDDGKENTTTEVVLRPYRGELTMLDRIESGNQGQSQGDVYNQSLQAQAPAPVSDILDDDIPF